MSLKAKIKSAILLGSTFTVVLLYQNCSKPVAQSSSSEGITTAQEITQQKALLVLTTKCSSCHNIDITSGGVDVLSVDSLLASGAIVPTEPSLSPLFNSITNGSMPPSKALAQADIEAISEWILSMKKDTPINLPEGSGPIPLAANYNSIYNNILKSRCLGCHNSGNPKGGLSFSTYNATMNSVQRTLPLSSSLYTSIAIQNTMPQGNPGSLGSDEKKVIFDWITAGALNN